MVNEGKIDKSKVFKSCVEVFIVSIVTAIMMVIVQVLKRYSENIMGWNKVVGTGYELFLNLILAGYILGLFIYLINMLIEDTINNG